ncbi:alcohol dehydrogenase catalytic domain-containing protein [Micromonospora sp. STR1_7]|uniref:Alcohol dehydrogenase catalytic domain-containing protein n=1 Tax=Micromonospora parastrephiae TaxID=2806101 RepID=A0ABS1XNS1_9ACTN|nr:alcohol dehydrogenase catalytic domain-containing protein [Micromonospora parastrephiae]MBM0230918.1 alcohol dehydrogenase catalytic domain-containing protein [Micromonospora parastrephiae]
MRAVVYADVRTVDVREVPDATLEVETDALVRITSTALCGTDLHMYDGRTSAEPGLVLGHEPLGVVQEVGSAVQTVRPGTRVVIPTHLFCGTCVMCARGLSAACLRARDEAPGAAYGYAGMGPYRGAQADLLRVPWADANCVPLPGEPGDAYEGDFVLLADAFVTGWHAAATLAEVEPGDTVAVFGAGTIGLLSSYSALLRGARAVYCVDGVDARLDKAGEIGAVPVDFRRGDPVERIRADRARAGLPLGEEKLGGVDKVIDAVGFQARDRERPDRERPNQVISDAARLVNAAGAIAVAGVYPDNDPHPAPGADGHEDLVAPWGTLFSKGATVRFGRTHDRRYTVLLRDLIVAGRARPGRIVTHHGTLADAPDLYRSFDRRENGVIKAVLHPS